MFNGDRISVRDDAKFRRGTVGWGYTPGIKTCPRTVQLEMIKMINFVIASFTTIKKKKMEKMKLLIIYTFLAPLILQMGRGKSINTASQTGDSC